MKFTQHIPAFMEDFPRIEFEFNNLEELLNNEFIKEIKSRRGFYRLSLSKESFIDYGYSLLMEELNDGYDWWVMGYIKDGILDGLPNWEPKYKS